MEQSNNNFWVRAVAITKAIACLCFLVPLAGFMVNALTFRFNGDDYCYLALININGLWKTQVISYFQNTPYSGDRYSATLITGLFSYLSPAQYGIATVLTIILWFVALIWISRSINRLKWLNLDWVGSILLAESVLVFTIYTAPNVTQSLYWRAGMMAYTCPLVGICFTMASILENYSRQKRQFLILLAPFFLAFLTGGFSETGGVIQLTVFGLVFMACVWVYFRYKNDYPLLLVGPAFLGAALAIMIVIISPANQYRLAGMKTISSFPQLLKLTVIYTKDFILESIRGQPIPVIISFLLALMLSIEMNQSTKRGFQLEFIKITASAVITVGLVASCIAPSVYAESGYPEARVLFTSRWILILGIFSFGVFAGNFWRIIPHRLQARPVTILVKMAVLLLVCAYPIYISPKIFTQIPAHQKLASLWDARDKKIWIDKGSGLLKIEVSPLDHMVQGVTELSVDPNFWYNTCAAGYYGVVSIRTTAASR